MMVRTSNGVYDIHFGSPEDIWQRVPHDAQVITDENVVRHCPGAERRDPIVVPAGEGSKSISAYRECLEALADARIHRKQPIVAFGGGVIGDLAGFVAATYMRGVPLIQIPTTVVAQVDSSVGGKVGIDLPQGKNLVGAFYPPTEVLVATDYLQTLNDREYRNGMAEVWKYGFILDAELLRLLECQSEPHADEQIIRRCIQLKVKVVEADEFETTGERAILNFGHTVGHAIEKLEQYRGNKHGEAVAIGMMAEARLGESLGITPSGIAERVRLGMVQQGLPTGIPQGLTTGAILDTMRLDKKAGAGGLAFSLLTDAGACKLVQNVPDTVVREVLDTCWA